MNILEINPNRVRLGNNKFDSEDRYLFNVSSSQSGEDFLFIPNINEETIYLVQDLNDEDFDTNSINIQYHVLGYRVYNRNSVPIEASVEVFLTEGRE